MVLRLRFRRRPPAVAAAATASAAASAAAAFAAAAAAAVAGVATQEEAYSVHFGLPLYALAYLCTVLMHLSPRRRRPTEILYASPKIASSIRMRPPLCRSPLILYYYIISRCAGRRIPFPPP